MQWVVVEYRIEGDVWLLYYGIRVEVLEPPSLRERVAEEHRRAAGVYGDIKST